MSDKNEIERLVRLREQQIRTRADPSDSKKKFEQISAQRRRGAKVTAGSVLKDIPAKVWWTLIGGLIGVIFTIIILNIPGAPSWAVFVGIGGIVFGIVIGFILGKAHDSGKEDWGTGRGGKRF